MVYVIGIVAALIILFGFLCYKKAPPTEAIVVTGFGLSKPKVVCGKGTFVLPVHADHHVHHHFHLGTTLVV